MSDFSDHFNNNTGSGQRDSGGVMLAGLERVYKQCDLHPHSASGIQAHAETDRELRTSTDRRDRSTVQLQCPKDKRSRRKRQWDRRPSQFSYRNLIDSLQSS